MPSFRQQIAVVFAGAAAGSSVSGSAISKAVARLEERCRSPLPSLDALDRPSSCGRLLFLDRCRRCSARSKAAELELSQIRRAPLAGHLRVSLPLIDALMMPAVMAFMRAYPEIERSLGFTDRLVDADRRRFRCRGPHRRSPDSLIDDASGRRSRTGSSRFLDYLAARGVCLRRPAICSVSPSSQISVHRQAGALADGSGRRGPCCSSRDIGT